MLRIHTPTKKDRPDLWNNVDDYDDKRSTNEDKDVLSLSGEDLNILTLLPTEFLHGNTVQSAVDGFHQNEEDFRLDDDELPDLAENLDIFQQGLVHSNPAFLQQILVGLCAERRGDKWMTYSVEDFYTNVLLNQKQIEQLTTYEMDVINNTFFSYTQKHLFRSERLKAHKVKVLCKLFGRKRLLHAVRPKSTKQVTLRKLTLDVINDVDYNVNILAVAVANMYHRFEKPKWSRNATVPMTIDIPYLDEDHVCFSFPEYNTERDKLEPKFLDPTHMLTNIRTHICTKGYRNVSREAFLRVSQCNNKVLNRAYITQIVDKQSAAIAMKFFSEDVERLLFENGDVSESEFCELVRNWYRAVDERGLHVKLRLEYMESMANYLRNLVNFNVYPPKKQYIAGIPVVTFESLLHNITSRIQLYHILDGRSFNHRSISTLSVESFFSLMSRMRGTYNGCPKATCLSSIFQNILHMEQLQSDPTNIFYVHVSNKKSYPDFMPMSDTESTHSVDADSENTIFSKHKFDVPRKKQKRKRCDDITTGNEQRKRICPVRIFFRPYEDKIKTTTRHGLPD